MPQCDIYFIVPQTLVPRSKFEFGEGSIPETRLASTSQCSRGSRVQTKSGPAWQLFPDPQPPQPLQPHST